MEVNILVIDLTIIYLILINVITFIAFANDKHRARKRQWRIPERNLLLLCGLGGSLGGLLAMYGLRHKTQHTKFTLGVPLIMALQVVITVAALMGGS